MNNLNGNNWELLSWFAHEWPLQKLDREESEVKLDISLLLPAMSSPHGCVCLPQLKAPLEAVHSAGLSLQIEWLLSSSNPFGPRGISSLSTVTSMYIIPLFSSWAPDSKYRSEPNMMSHLLRFLGESTCESSSGCNHMRLWSLGLSTPNLLPKGVLAWG